MIHWYRKTDVTTSDAKIWIDKLAVILKLHSDDRAKRFLASHYVWDYSFILSQIKDLPPGAVIMDAGGGHGALQFLLARKHEVWNTDRNDYAEEIAELRQITGTEVNFVQGELGQTKFENDFFDCIISCSTLEHNPFEELKKVVTELDRILKPGGKLVMTLVGWYQDMGYRQYIENDWVEGYTDKKIETLFEGTNLKLSGESNFDEIMLCIIQFQQVYPGYDHPWIPVGVVAEKVKEA